MPPPRTRGTSRLVREAFPRDPRAPSLTKDNPNKPQTRKNTRMIRNNAEFMKYKQCRQIQDTTITAPKLTDYFAQNMRRTHCQHACFPSPKDERGERDATFVCTGWRGTRRNAWSHLTPKSAKKQRQTFLHSFVLLIRTKVRACASGRRTADRALQRSSRERVVRASRGCHSQDALTNP